MYALQIFLSDNFFFQYIGHTADTIRLLLLAQYLRRLNKQGGNFSKMDQWNCRTSAGAEQRGIVGAGTKRRVFRLAQTIFCTIGGGQRSDGQDAVGGLVLRCSASVWISHRWACSCVYLYVTCLPAWHMAGKIAAVDKTLQHLWFYARVAQYVCSMIIPSALLHTHTPHTHTTRWWQTTASPWSQGSIKRTTLFSWG